MNVVVYDGSFAGLMSAIFDIYERKMNDVELVKEADICQTLFDGIFTAHACTEKYERVWKGVCNKISTQSRNHLFRAFLSEQRGVEAIILGYVRYVFRSATSIEQDYRNPFVLQVNQLSKKVYREKHRMEAFVRFQLTADQLYFSLVDPDFNVLPLICDHFTERYADQRWLIYDTRRKFGIYYDLQQSSEVTLDFLADPTSEKDLAAIYDPSETLYQQLWKQYFQSVNISSRKNMRLHIQHMPRRYWKNLIEKK